MAYTPMIEQYLSVKQQAGDAFLFFRLGDFYELFFEDAKLASRLLEITLTGRDGGMKERIPMCGVPYHSAESYIQRLVDLGYKVAICEQVESPGAAKGIVKREIVQIVTPGTRIAGDGDSKLPQKLVQYLAAIVPSAGETSHFGIALCDVGTGEFYVTEKPEHELFDFLHKWMPSEIVSTDVERLQQQTDQLQFPCTITSFFIESQQLLQTKVRNYYHLSDLTDLTFYKQAAAVKAAGLLLAYLDETQRRHLDHLKRPIWLDEGEQMPLDSAAIRNLELVQGLRDGNETGTLFAVLNRTRSAAGARLLRQWILAPSRSIETIRKRADAVQFLIQDLIFREEIREALDQVYDLERLMARISYGTANARDLLAIRTTLQTLPTINELLSASPTTELLQTINHQLLDVSDLTDLLERALKEPAPISVREGGMIQSGFSAELDELNQRSQNGRDFLAALETAEREKTGIRNLKVGYTKVFGYYFEVSKANLHLVPADWRRKQTLANGERFVTEELQRHEEMLVHADERRVELEYQLFCEVRDQVKLRMGDIQQIASGLAMLDTLQSLATVSAERGYIRPIVKAEAGIQILEGRHPVVEATHQQQFVANNVQLDPAKRQIAILTGPNMAGKSTYMRQTALLVILAQIGCFVPAESCEIGIVDRVFTRIGAADDLSKGQSTFMVEMVELASILHEATDRSLLLLDEVGRGTSTYDGMAIAQAVLEYLHQDAQQGPMTLFATHYHELTPLSQKWNRMFNLSMHVQEVGEDVVFLRKVLEQPADRSYGIQVAKLAGLPKEVLVRAQEVLRQHEQAGSDLHLTRKAAGLSSEQLEWFLSAEQAAASEPKSTHWLIEAIESVDINHTTPFDALQLLALWKKRLSEEA